MKKYVILLAILSMFIISGCATWEREVKDAKSDFSGGLDRTIIVYDYNGNEITSYEGKIDLSYEDTANKVKFDLNGKRTVIYGGIVIVQEK